jgi:predicted small integral membrane protein
MIFCQDQSLRYELWHRRSRRRSWITSDRSLPDTMLEGAVYIKSSKVLLVWAVAFFASLVVFNNLTDYDSNYMFVGHVLKMDTTFSGNRAMWRAIDSPSLHHAIYWLIIFAEAVIAVLCWLGGFRLFSSINDSTGFNKSKGLAIIGLTLGIVFWFTGFITVGGEWFLMWQSEKWNGQEAAFRLVVIIGIVLLYISQPDRDSDA